MMQRFPVPLAVIAAASLAAPGVAHAGPSRFDIGVQDPLEFQERDPAGAYGAIRSHGLKFVRLPVNWPLISGARPPGDAADPDNGHYAWRVIDDRLDRIIDSGRTPLFVVYNAPVWSDPSDKKTVRVSDFRDFVTAAAKRYSGRSGQRPRVRYWQLWNEPNLKMFLDDTPAHYRELVNAGYDAVKDVHRDNVVIAGGLGPFSDPENRFGIAPFPYMRSLLRKPVKFDVWSHHPYTSGGPNHSAAVRTEASLGDLPEMKRVLDAAKRAGRVRTRTFWVTEFGWDTNPPDPGGIPLDRQARWTAEAMYRMWQSGISTMVWFKLRDDPAPPDGNWGGTFQGGIFENTADLYRDEKEKPVGKVLSFPFSAVLEGRRVAVWGRTPSSRRATVRIERQRGNRWVRVATVRAGTHGVFFKRLAGNRGALLRARVGGSDSLPFKTVRTPDIRVNAFGGPPPRH
jgi:hypothetical protein